MDAVTLKACIHYTVLLHIVRPAPNMAQNASLTREQNSLLKTRFATTNCVSVVCSDVIIINCGLQ